VAKRKSAQNKWRDLALIGARTRLAELRQEEADLRRQFPELGARGGAAAAAASSGEAAPGRKRRRRRKPMSAAQKKAVSERMRKYWADRKKKTGK
jgi:hypothetical protein